MRGKARSFIVLCVAACIVAALLGGALLSARHGAHRYFCADNHCKICFTVEAQLSLLRSFGILALGLAMFAFAVLLARAAVCLLAEKSRRLTLLTLGIRLNS